MRYHTPSCLAIDTSTRYAGVALVRDGEVVAELLWRSHRNHTVELFPGIEHLLKKAGEERKGLGAIVVARGPGSFSALRVGISAAKGLAWALGIPLVGVSTLEVEAFPFASLGMPLCPLLDMGRGEVAMALYAGPEEAWRCLKEKRLVPLSELPGEVPQDTLFCGEGALPLAQALQQRFQGKALIALQRPPTRRPGVLAQLGLRRLARGEKEAPASLQPLYLREPSIGAKGRSV